MPDGAPGVRGTTSNRLLAAATVILAAAALKLGQPVLLPLTLGVFLVDVIWPLEARPRRVDRAADAVRRAPVRRIGRPAVVFAGLGLLQFFIGNFVDPKIGGRMLSLSPFLILFAVVFWGLALGKPRRGHRGAARRGDCHHAPAIRQRPLDRNAARGGEVGRSRPQGASTSR